ncbi:hypothetical protein [Shewanella sp. UCD-KL12]|uniref:hypothetical protein n=1 Tax=Shewanella sp. UCD-KL12 TaxID=1917163 RepID=UPI00097048BB|nr:hypothetical protein [Shewanella sp. UCD-KL12]
MDKSIIVFGTVFAAFIAGVFSFFNLVNSKEQKVSEFRQAWIDSFRGEVSLLVSSVAYISFYYQSIRETPPQTQDIEESYKDYVAACAGLITRLNAQDPDIRTKHTNSMFLETLTELRDSFNNQKYSEVHVLSKHLVENSKPLLKAEWERVKIGEKGYRKNKRIALGLCLVGLLATAVFARYLYVASPIINS